MREDTSDYDKRAIAEIHQWKTPELSWLGQAMRAVDWPLSQAGDWILEQQLVGAAIRKAISGVVGVCNDAAQWSVRQEAIYDEFRRAGHDLETPDDFASLRLEDIDRVVGYLDAKYKGLAAVEGAATGVAGLPGIVVDLPALVMLNLRAIGEYATYYGFDVTVQHERLFAMNVLGLASSPKDTAKQIAMAELVQIARDVAMRRSWTALEEHAFVQSHPADCTSGRYSADEGQARASCAGSRGRWWAPGSMPTTRRESAMQRTTCIGRGSWPRSTVPI